jgi:hypothetical protein
MLSQVAPPRRPKYFGFGRAYTLVTGTTNRIPSTEATSPPPHAWASGMAAWCSISVAFAAQYVASRRYVWSTWDRRPYFSASAAPMTGV